MVSLFVVQMHTEYYPGDQVKKVGRMGCVTFKEHRGYWWGNLKEMDWLEDQGIDGIYNK